MKGLPARANSDRCTIAYKRIDDNTFEGTSKKAGKVVSTVRIAVVKDGKTMTVTVKGKNAKGK